MASMAAWRDETTAVALLAIALCWSAIPSNADAEEAQRRGREPALEGPFPARIDRVIEGDHFEIDFDFGPILRGQQRLRLSNANTPSPFSDRPCEERLGREVVALVRDLLKPQQVWVRDFRRGRYSREHVGRIIFNNKARGIDQVDLGEYLIVLGFAEAYDDSVWNPSPRYWACPDESSQDPADSTVDRQDPESATEP